MRYNAINSYYIYIILCGKVLTNSNSFSCSSRYKQHIIYPQLPIITNLLVHTLRVTVVVKLLKKKICFKQVVCMLRYDNECAISENFKDIHLSLLEIRCKISFSIENCKFSLLQTSSRFTLFPIYLFIYSQPLCLNSFSLSLHLSLSLTVWFLPMFLPPSFLSSLFQSV